MAKRKSTKKSKGLWAILNVDGEVVIFRGKPKFEEGDVCTNCDGKGRFEGYHYGDEVTTLCDDATKSFGGLEEGVPKEFKVVVAE